MTPTTSIDMAGRPELARFTTMTTLMYTSPMQRDQIEWTAQLPTLHQLERIVERTAIRADIVFIDPWHTYEDSRRVLHMALRIVNAGGHIVVHDCDPPSPGYAAALPAWSYAHWTGQTWRAYVDVATRLPASWRYSTIDADYGIGVISVPDDHTARSRLSAVRDIAARRRLLRQLEMSDPMVPSALSSSAAWHWLQDRRANVLNLRTAVEWVDALGFEARRGG